MRTNLQTVRFEIGKNTARLLNLKSDAADLFLVENFLYHEIFFQPTIIVVLMYMLLVINCMRRILAYNHCSANIYAFNN